MGLSLSEFDWFWVAQIFGRACRHAR